MHVTAYIRITSYNVCYTKLLREAAPGIALFPFSLYIITHELIHIVRFSKFLQNFEASDRERMAEEKRVHQRTHLILQPVQVTGLASVLEFYNDWHVPYEGLRDP